MHWPGVEPGTSQSPVQHANHYTTKPPHAVNDVHKMNKWSERERERTCQTPTSAFAIRIRSITNGSTKAVSCSSDSSNHANTCQTGMIHAILTTSSAIAGIADCTAQDLCCRYRPYALSGIAMVSMQEYLLIYSFEQKSAFAARQIFSRLLFFCGSISYSKSVWGSE